MQSLTSPLGDFSGYVGVCIANTSKEIVIFRNANPYLPPPQPVPVVALIGALYGVADL